MTLYLFVLFVSLFILAAACLCSLYRSHHGPAHSERRLKSLVPHRLKPRSPLACPACCRSAARSSGQELSSRDVRPWREIKSRRGAPKRVMTGGFACPNRASLHSCFAKTRLLWPSEHDLYRAGQSDDPSWCGRSGSTHMGDSPPCPPPAGSAPLVASVLSLCTSSCLASRGLGSATGERRVQRYRQRTPAMAAGRATRRWTAGEVLCYPLPPVPT